jgi:hypothetical protein
MGRGHLLDAHPAECLKDGSDLGVACTAKVKATRDQVNGVARQTVMITMPLVVRTINACSGMLVPSSPVVNIPSMMV